MGLLRATVVWACIAGLAFVAAPAAGQGGDSTCFGRPVTITARPGITTIGTDGADVIAGTGGPDVIVGGGGDDHICAGAGDDVVSGNHGRDRIHGGSGVDRLFGGKGDDEIAGGTGADVVIGNTGDDTLRGGRGNDVLRGKRGDDVLRGWRGRDVLRGGGGHDFCRGGPGDDTLRSCNEPPRPTPPAPGASVHFTAAGDYGISAEATATLHGIRNARPRFNLALGDLSYRGAGSELEWCDYVRGIVGDLPMQLIAGNHEDDNGGDGDIGNFAACLPDGMNSSGVYGAEYFFDVDSLVRVVMVAADSTVDGVTYDYARGTSRHRWLEGTIQDARDAGIPWIVVGMHKVCVSAGNKVCEVGQDLLDLLLDQRVDLILHGHDHNYQRSKQLTCAVARRYLVGCVVDDGADAAYARGAGAVWVVAGATGGRPMYPVNENDPEIDYLAAWMGADHPQAGRGFLDITVTAAELTVQFVGSTTSYSDAFSIS